MKNLLPSKQAGVELVAKEQATELGRSTFRGLYNKLNGIVDSTVEEELQEIIDQHSPLTNRKGRRLLARTPTATKLTSDAFFKGFMDELILYIGNLTYASGQMDIDKKDKATQLLAFAIQELILDDGDVPPDMKAMEKWRVSPAVINVHLASILNQTKRLYDKYNQFDGMEAVINNVEKARGSVPVGFLHDIANSDIFDPEKDPAFVAYVTNKFDAGFKSDPTKTVEIVALILGACSQEPAGVALAKPLIEAAAVKLPHLFATNRNAAETFATNIESFIDGIDTDAPDSVRNRYRLSVLKHAKPLIESSPAHAASMFDRIFPENASVDKKFRDELTPHLLHISKYNPDLAIALFTRLAYQSLETDERESLRKIGGSLFNYAVEEKPDNAMRYWNSILKLCDDGDAIIATVGATLPSAQMRFIHDAAFAKSYLSEINTTFTSDESLLGFVRGSDMVTSRVGSNFVVVGNANQTSILNGGKKAISGSAADVLGKFMGQHPDRLADVLSTVTFVATAQGLLSGQAVTHKRPSYHQLVMGKVQEIARAFC